MRTFKIPKYFNANKVIVEVVGQSINVKFYESDDVLLLDYSPVMDANYYWYDELNKKVKHYTNRGYAYEIVEYICKQLRKQESK